MENIYFSLPSVSLSTFLCLRKEILGDQAARIHGPSFGIGPDLTLSLVWGCSAHLGLFLIVCRLTSRASVIICLFFFFHTNKATCRLLRWRKRHWRIHELSKLLSLPRSSPRTFRSGQPLHVVVVVWHKSIIAYVEICTSLLLYLVYHSRSVL